VIARPSANFFVGDPNLNQVVAHTAEAGARGKLVGANGGQVSWNVDYYHPENTDDIIYESTVANPNLAFYTNAGKTLRQCIEVNMRYDWSSITRWRTAGRSVPKRSYKAVSIASAMTRI
jgi:outer membrane receptor protein involved in Fe transport